MDFLPVMNIIEPGAPQPVAERIWLDKRSVVDFQRFRQTLDEAYQPSADRVKEVDKLEQTGPVWEYRPERATPVGETEQILLEERDDSARMRRAQNVASEYLRDRYIGGTGMNLDEIA